MPPAYLSQSSVVAAEEGAISAASAAAMVELCTVMGISTNMSRHDSPLARIFSIVSEPAAQHSRPGTQNQTFVLPCPAAGFPGD